MPIKFSELPVKTITETSKVIGLYTDNASNTGVSNCLINTSDFAKQTKLTEVDESAVHIYGSEQIIGDKTFIGKVVINNTLSITEPITISNSLATTGSITTTNTINGIKAASSDSTSETLIPTIGWVNDPTTASNVVHRTSNETIAGTKTFTNISVPIKFKNNNVEQMTNPSEYSEQMVYGVDKNDIRIGSMGIGMTADGNSRAYIAASKKIGDTYKYCVIDTYIDKSGNVWATAPTPSSPTDNSTKIATTNWFRNTLTNLLPTIRMTKHSDISTSLPYTAPIDGIMRVKIGAVYSWLLYINGVVVQEQSRNDSDSCVTTWIHIPVKKGDVLTASGSKYHFDGGQMYYPY